jgi:hypothetical protein
MAYTVYSMCGTQTDQNLTDLVLVDQDIYLPATADTAHASAAGVAAHSQVGQAAVSTNRRPGTGHVGQLSMQPVVKLEGILHVTR